MKTLLILLLLCFPVGAQQFTYGSPSELKGVTKVFIDTGPDLKNRERIVKEIAKVPALTIVDDIALSEVVLAFGAGSERSLAGIVTNPPAVQGGATFSYPSYRKVSTGTGYVVKPDGDKLRILMDFSDAEKTIWEKKPATNFAKTFIKAYKKANGLK